MKPPGYETTSAADRVLVDYEAAAAAVGLAPATIRSWARDGIIERHIRGRRTVVDLADVYRVHAQKTRRAT